MAMADVLVLRSGEAGGGRGPGTGGPPRERMPVTASASADGPPAGDTTAAAGEAPWPAAWLPALLADAAEEETVDGVLHRYRGARVLHTSGCREIEVTGAPSDPTAVRVTAMWRDGVPDDVRAAVVSWITARAAGQGWQPDEEDHLVGSVVVEQYVPHDTRTDDAATPLVVHDWQPFTDDGMATRTSGRRT